METKRVRISEDEKLYLAELIEKDIRPNAYTYLASEWSWRKKLQNKLRGVKK